MCQLRFRLDFRKYFFMENVVAQSSESLSLKGFKILVDVALGDMEQWWPGQCCSGCTDGLTGLFQPQSRGFQLLRSITASVSSECRAPSAC